jgi:hypothetical protein
MRGCNVIASGQNGHGIQLVNGVAGNIKKCLFRGFNGVRGVTPAYALDVAGSTVNGDFVYTNYFVQQERIVLERA